MECNLFRNNVCYHLPVHLIFLLLPEHPKYGRNFVLIRYSLRFKGVKINVFFSIVFY